MLYKKAATEFKDRDGHTPLLQATGKGHEAAARRLISAGANVFVKSKTGNTPLMLAADHGHSILVHQLIAKGSKVNEKNIAGNTALLMAVKNGHLETAKVLLSQGADPYLRNNNREQAHVVVPKGRDDILALLENHNNSKSWLADIFSTK